MTWKYRKWNGPGVPPSWEYEHEQSGSRGWCHKRSGRRDGQKNSWEWQVNIIHMLHTASGVANNEDGAKRSMVQAVVNVLRSIATEAETELEQLKGETGETK